MYKRPHRSNEALPAHVTVPNLPRTEENPVNRALGAGTIVGVRYFNHQDQLCLGVVGLNAALQSP